MPCFSAQVTNVELAYSEPLSTLMASGPPRQRLGDGQTALRLTGQAHDLGFGETDLPHRNLRVHPAEKILRPHPLNQGGLPLLAARRSRFHTAPFGLRHQARGSSGRWPRVRTVAGTDGWPLRASVRLGRRLAGLCLHSSHAITRAEMSRIRQGDLCRSGVPDRFAGTGSPRRRNATTSSLPRPNQCRKEYDVPQDHRPG